MNEPKVGVLTEQGYFGEGYGFQEASAEDRERIENEAAERDRG